MPRAYLAAQRSSCKQPTEEHTMFELDSMNPDVMRAGVAYRREQLIPNHRRPAARRWLRLRLRRGASPSGQ